MSSISRAWPLAVSGTSTSTPASTSAVARSQASPKNPIAAATRSRPSASLVACGYCSVLTKSLTVISPRQPAGAVDQRQLLDLVLGEQRGGVGAGDAHRRGDQRHRGHQLAHGARRELLGRHEEQVAVGDDAEQRAVGGDDRQPGDAVLPAQRVELGQGRVRADRDRVGHHARLGPLDQVDLVGLLLDREVAVQHADAALAGHRDRHPGLGDGVHRGRQQRDARRRSRGSAGRWCPPRDGTTSVSCGSSRTSSKVRASGARLSSVVRGVHRVRRRPSARACGSDRPCYRRAVAPPAPCAVAAGGFCADLRRRSARRPPATRRRRSGSPSSVGSCRRRAD